MGQHGLRLFAFVIAAAIGCAAPVSAQSTTGRIAGGVSDSSGAVLPGVAVTATHSGTAFARTALTDSRGAYVLVDMPIGTYTIKAELEGFKTAVKTDYVLVADGRLGVDFALEVGALSEMVTVTVARRDGQHDLRRDRARGRSGAGPEPGAERAQLHAARHR